MRVANALWSYGGSYSPWQVVLGWLFWGLLLIAVAYACGGMREIALNSRWQVPPEHRATHRYRGLSFVATLIGICGALSCLVAILGALAQFF
jgi:hypothetical protein